MFPYLSQNKQNRLISPLSPQKQMPESSGSEISLCNTREKQLFDPSSCRGDVSSSDELKNQKPVCEVRLLLGENKIAVRSISA